MIRPSDHHSGASHAWFAAVMAVVHRIFAAGCSAGCGPASWARWRAIARAAFRGREVRGDNPGDVAELGEVNPDSLILGSRAIASSCGLGPGSG
jgi:hypothetical protein